MLNPCQFTPSWCGAYTCGFLFRPKWKEAFFHRFLPQNIFQNTKARLGLRWCKHKSIPVAMTHRGLSGKGAAAQLYNKGGHTDSGGLHPADCPRLLDEADTRRSSRAAVCWHLWKVARHCCSRTYLQAVVKMSLKCYRFGLAEWS